MHQVQGANHNMTKDLRLLINEIRSRNQQQTIMTNLLNRATTNTRSNRRNHATTTRKATRRLKTLHDRSWASGQIFLHATLWAILIGNFSFFVLANGQFLFTYEITNNNKDDFDNLRQNSFKNSLFDPSNFKIVTPSQLQSSYQKLASSINVNPQAPPPTSPSSTSAVAAPQSQIVSTEQSTASDGANLADLADDAELDDALAPSPPPLATTIIQPQQQQQQQPQLQHQQGVRSANSFRPENFMAINSNGESDSDNGNASDSNSNSDDHSSGDNDVESGSRGQKLGSPASSSTPAQTSFLKQTTAALQSFAEIFSNFANSNGPEASQAPSNSGNGHPLSSTQSSILQHQPQLLNGLINQQQQQQPVIVTQSSPISTNENKQRQHQLAANQQAEARSLHDHWTQEQQRAYNQNQQQRHQQPALIGHPQSLKFTIQGPQSHPNQHQNQHLLQHQQASPVSGGSAMKSFTTTPTVSLQKQMRIHHQQNHHQPIHHPFPLGAQHPQNQHGPSHVVPRSPQNQQLQQQQANSQAAFWLTANPLANAADGNYLVEIKQPQHEHQSQQEQPEVSTATLVDNLLAVGHQRAHTQPQSIRPTTTTSQTHHQAHQISPSSPPQHRASLQVAPPAQGPANFVSHLKAPVGSQVYSTTMPTTTTVQTHNELRLQEQQPEVTSTQSSSSSSSPLYFASNSPTNRDSLQPPINVPENYQGGVALGKEPSVRKSAQETLISYRLERQNQVASSQPAPAQPLITSNELQQDNQREPTQQFGRDEPQSRQIVMTRQPIVEQQHPKSTAHLNSEIPQVSPQIYESFLLQQKDQHEKHMELLKQQLELNKLLEQEARERQKTEDDEDSKRIVRPKASELVKSPQVNSSVSSEKDLQSANLPAQSQTRTQASATSRQDEIERARKLEYELEEKRRLADELETAQRVAAKNKRDREEREQRERSELAARRQRFEEESKQRRLAADERRRAKELAEQREQEAAAATEELERERVRKLQAEQEAATRERELREREARERQEALKLEQQKRELEKKQLAIDRKQALELEQRQNLKMHGQQNKRARSQQQKQQLDSQVVASPAAAQPPTTTNGGWGTPIGLRAARAGLNARPNRASNGAPVAAVASATPSTTPTTTTTSSTTTTTQSTASTALFMGRGEYATSSQTTPMPMTTLPVSTSPSTRPSDDRSQKLASEVGEKYRSRNKKARIGASAMATQSSRFDDKQIREKIPLYSGPGQYGLYRNESVARSELAALLDSVSLPATPSRTTSTTTPTTTTTTTTTPAPEPTNSLVSDNYGNENSYSSNDNFYSTSLSPLLPQSNRIELNHNNNLRQASRRQTTGNLINNLHSIDGGGGGDDFLRRSKPSSVISRSSRNAAVTAATPTTSSTTTPVVSRSRSSWRSQPKRRSSHSNNTSDLLSSTSQQQPQERSRPARIGLASLPPDADNDGIPGRAGIEYPVLEKIPVTSFTCSKQPLNGYYADTETACQVVHLCQGGVQSSILCPNGTIFNQEKFSCQWWYEVNCSRAPMFYQLNDNLYKQAKPRSGSQLDINSNTHSNLKEFSGAEDESSDDIEDSAATAKKPLSSSRQQNSISVGKSQFNED